MLTRNRFSQIPELPRIVSDLPIGAEQAQRIRQIMAEMATHGIHNRYVVDGVKNKWGHQAMFELAEIRASDKPFDAERPYNSLANEDPPLHIALVAKTGEIHGFQQCSSASPVTTVQGVVMQDKRGRGWLCAAETQNRDFLKDTSAIFTGRNPLKEIYLDTLPVLQGRLPHGGPQTLDAMPTFAGHMDLQSSFISYFEPGLRPVTAGDDHLMPGLAAMADQLEAILLREDKIIAAVTDFLRPDRLAELFDVQRVLKTGKIFPSHRDEGYAEVEESQFSLCLNIAVALREAGMLAEIPNGGYHMIRGVEPWNMLVRGEIDQNTGTDFRDPLYSKRRDLTSSPLFQMIRRGLFEAVYDAEEQAWKAKNPGKDYNAREKSKDQWSPQEIDTVLKACSEHLIERLYRESSIELIGMELRSRLDDRLPLCIEGGPLRPFLAVRGEGQNVTPLPVTDEPAIARHLELSLPSGRLAMADWFRIPGFHETIEAGTGGDNFEISTALGRDEGTRAYYEKFGFISVGGATSPRAYEDTAGIWRMGSVADEGDRFYDEDGKPTGLKPPMESWRISSAYWATTFADVDTIADILMTSGKYESKAEAVGAIEEYCADHGNTIQDIGPGTLHVYMPTGYGERSRKFDQFQVGELEYGDWRNDYFLISREPLTVTAGKMEDCDWVEGGARPSGPAGPIGEDAPSP